MASDEQGGGPAATSFLRPTVADLESALARYRLNFDRLRDPLAERAKLPNMVATFEHFTALNGGYPPEQATFVDAFASTYGATHRWLFTETRERGTRARLSRAYPSLVRDYHLELLLTEAGYMCFRSAEADSRWGVDLVAINGGYAIRLNCYVATGAAQAWRHVKARKRGQIGYAIDIPLYRSRARWVGEFLLYSTLALEMICSTMVRLLPLEAHSARHVTLSAPPVRGWWAA